MYFTDAIADDTVRYQYVKKKGYVRLHTNKGDLNLELHCDKVRVLTQKNNRFRWKLARKDRNSYDWEIIRMIRVALIRF